MRPKKVLADATAGDGTQGMNPRTLLAFAALLAAPAALAELPSDPAHGYWLTENRKAIIRIAPCGQDTCGQMVWMKNAVDRSGEPKRDTRNSDAAKRGRPICGLPLAGGLTKAGEGAWRDGWVYNPKDGGTYSAEIRVLSRSELEVRGYVGVPVLGKSQIWTRVEDDRGGCSL
jgi:uncharacterized protein (DUF2147 family)